MEEGRREENLALSALLEQDREMVMTQLSGSRTQEEALKVLEKEADRLMYQAGALETGPTGMGQAGTKQAGSGPYRRGSAGIESAAAVQGMLQVMKNMLPLIGSVSEAEVWEKETGGNGSAARSIPLPAIICGAAGAACVIAGLIGSPLGLLRIFQVLWTAAGCALLLLGGYLAGRSRGKDGGKRTKGRRNAQNLQQTFLVDPALIWHTLQGTLLGADHALESAQEAARTAQQAESSDAAGGMAKSELQFFSDLLENAYARRRQFPSDEGLGEQIENIRYYLHSRGIETEDYSSQSAKWFEILPADRNAVTIRPALVKDGVVVMKGVASGRR